MTRVDKTDVVAKAVVDVAMVMVAAVVEPVKDTAEAHNTVDVAEGDLIAHTVVVPVRNASREEYVTIPLWSRKGERMRGPEIAPTSTSFIVRSITRSGVPRELTTATAAIAPATKAAITCFMVIFYLLLKLDLLLKLTDRHRCRSGRPP
jgi:hypothetical protein